MPDIDLLIGKWAQEHLLHGALSVDTGASEQVWDAVTKLRTNFTPKNAEDAAVAVDKWFTETFSNAPPLTHNTPAFNQVRAAAEKLKARFVAVFEEAATAAPASPPPPPPTAPPAPKAQPASDKE